MVGAAILYGRKIDNEMGQETVARERYRVELEQQMEERTHALRESEAALAQAASEWRRTFDAIDSPVMILDLEGRLVRANATVRALTGKGATSGVTGRIVTSMGDRRALGHGLAGGGGGARGPVVPVGRRRTTPRPGGAGTSPPT